VRKSPWGQLRGLLRNILIRGRGRFAPPVSRRRGAGQVVVPIPGMEPITLKSYYAAFESYYKTCEPDTKRWMTRSIQPEFVCLDAGANVGYFSILMARMASRGLVYSFEPTETIQMLKNNLVEAGIDNALVFSHALGRQTGEFYEPLFRIWGRRAEHRKYSFLAIDDFVLQQKIERLDVLKIDVDGFDVEVLEGARKTLANLRPRCVIELNHALATRQASVGDALVIMRDAGYHSVHILDSENYLFLTKAQEKERKVEGASLRMILDRPI